MSEGKFCSFYHRGRHELSWLDLDRLILKLMSFINCFLKMPVLTNYQRTLDELFRDIFYRWLDLFSAVLENLIIVFWCCIWFVILCFAFTHWQYLSTWSSKTAMSDSYDLLLWSRSSFFSFFIMSVCWATLISALLITVLEWTLIKESYCDMLTFAYNKRIRFKKPNLSNGSFGATNLPQVVFSVTQVMMTQSRSGSVPKPKLSQWKKEKIKKTQ